MVNIRGISYLVDEMALEDIQRGLTIIAEDLQCNAVMLICRDTTQLILAARFALDIGLNVYLRPDATDRTQSWMLANLAEVAEAAETLRRHHPDRVTLLVGSEFSHTVPGVVPGPKSFARLWLIIRYRRVLRRRIDRRLHKLLTRTVAVARHRFHGPITYSAAAWENPDWSAFDLVAVSLYRAARNHSTYGDRLHALAHDHGKPMVVSEFGCGAFTAADQRGAGSFQIVDWFANPARIRGDHPRDESVQARYLTELIDLYNAEGIHGYFVFTFTMPDFVHRADPQFDLDKAGFAVMAALEDGTYRPKQAFRAIADRHNGAT
ncbi:glycoside hydrolase family 113 [Antrihabitans spumae]|uniref:glycoside hydrolase family 113 n=1 Tax=Antrihabitans spumae TaxID=3373370 RepID=UPI00375394A5